MALADGELRGGRREFVEAHLQTCPDCRRWLARFEETAGLLRREPPPGDVTARRVALKERLHREVARHDRPLLMRSTRAARLLVVLALALLAWPWASEADELFGRFVRFGEVRLLGPREEGTPIRGVASPLPGVATVSFATVEPARLPLGLARTGRSIPAPDRLELSYGNGADLTILVTELPAREGVLKLEPGTPANAATVRDTQVLWLPDPQPEAVAALYWERWGVVFEVLVLEAPLGNNGGLKLGDAITVVEAIMAAQDAAE